MVHYSSLARVYPLVNAGQSLVFWVLILAGFLGVAWFREYSADITLGGTTVAVVLGAIMSAYSYSAARARGYAIRQHDLVFRTGLFWVKQTIQPLKRLQHVEVTRGPIEKRAGIARVRVFSAGSGSATFSIPGLPVEEAELLREFVLAYEAPS